jgi:hypothetical protein
MWEDNIKIYAREIGEQKCGLNWTDSRHGPVARFCEHC